MSLAASLLVASAVLGVERYTSIYKADHDLPRALGQILASPSATADQLARALASMTKGTGRRLTGQVLDADAGLFVGFGSVKTEESQPADSHDGLVLHVMWQGGLTATLWELKRGAPQPERLEGPTEIDASEGIETALLDAFGDKVNNPES